MGAENNVLKASLVIEARMSEVKLAMTFERNLGGRSTVFLDRDLCESVPKLRKQLLKNGAAIAGDRTTQLKLLEIAVSSMDQRPQILPHKPGFQDGAYVLGRTVHGPNSKQYFADLRPRTKLGLKGGTIEDWKLDVGAVLEQSTMGAFALMAGLSAPLYTYLNARASAVESAFVSETATFNFWGESGSGRTTVLRAIAGLYGNPDHLSDWNFTARGLEEDCEQHNDLPLVLDDIEKFRPRNGWKLADALRAVNQTIPSGKSQTMSNVAKMNDLPELIWRTVGMSSSPKPIDGTVPVGQWTRSKGEEVRLFDLGVPPRANGGIFDRMNCSPDRKIAKGTELISKLEAGIARNFGIAMPVFVEYVLEQDRAEAILKYVDRFIGKFAKDGDGYDRRLAKKFALAYAAGKLAIKAGLLPWKKSTPVSVAEAAYLTVVNRLRTEAINAAAKVLELARRSDTDAFKPVKQNRSKPYRLGEREIGIRLEFKGERVCAMRDVDLDRLCGSRALRKEVLNTLRECDALVPGQGHAGTLQLPVRLATTDMHGNKVSIGKPRFHVIKIAKLKTFSPS